MHARESLVTPPSVEPLTLTEARTQVHVDTSDEDVTLENLIRAARERVELETNRALLAQTWDLVLPWFPTHRIEVPKPPLMTVTSVTYIDTAGAPQIWASSLYQVQKPAGPVAERGLIQPVYGEVWPLTRPDTFAAVTVRFQAGYGTDRTAVPQALRQAMLLILESWVDGECQGNSLLSCRSSDLIAPFINRPVYCV